MNRRIQWKWIVVMSFMILALVGCQNQSKDEDIEGEPDSSQESGGENADDEPDEPDAMDEQSQEYDLEDGEQAMAMAYVLDIVSGNSVGLNDEYPLSQAMKDELSPAMYQELAEAVVAQYGHFEEILGSGKDEQNGYRIWHVYVRYHDGAITWNVVFDADENIAGLNMAPYNGEVDEDASDESEEELGTEVTVGTKEYPLEGTYIEPEEGKPVVVFVQGSGPSDRDETIGPNKPFKTMAKSLAQSGIGSLRYDKRTYVYGNEMAENIELTFYEETVEDVKEAVTYLHEEKGVDYDAIIVMGHSMGGYLVPMIDHELAEGEESASIGGYILLAGNHRSLSTIIPKQLLYIARLEGDVTQEQQEEIDAVSEALSMVDEQPDDEAVFGAYPTYWRGDIAYNPATYASAVTEPVLVLQGEADYQVTMEDFVLWQQVWDGKDNATFISYPGLNHLMSPVEGVSRPEEYNVKTPMSEEVLEDISQWLLER